ncbi:AMP-dependent synthetase/ligase [Acidipropionibacterium virtanenii]|uniref:Acyl-CoA synthetase n=1 Tax=Acidipropionibacterium virtanenii TaxID=2057246 RepID=A0A344USW0_9ACTN|nr:long-chain fatty acid--CoA ligase [Acidipropionibacterium virtanenii]AXE38358.1 Long-chain-fatty-acid--CoA ligase FadD15 [Acidipropionibacterium virtanenii]
MSLQNGLTARSARNFGALLDRQADEHPDRIAFLIPRGADDEANTWVPMTFAEFRRQAHAVAAGLLDLGLEREQRAAIMSGTRTEWIVADMGVSCAGGATTTVYPNTNAEETSYILTDSDSRIVFVDTVEQLRKIRSRSELDDHVRAIILFDGDEGDAGDERVMSMADLIARGRRRLAAEPDLVRRVIESIEPTDLATLIYTSGTTGTPKGVEIEHRSWTYMGAAWEYKDFIHGDDVHLLWLPLSHAFGKCLLAICIQIGVTQAVEGRIPRLVRSIAEVKPDVMCGVPRIFEKIRAGVMTRAPQGRLQSRIAHWAFAVGRDSRPYRLQGRPMPPMLAARYRVADRLVFSTLRRSLGDVRFMISGGAKLSPQVQEWFYSAGVPIVEGYGATELCAVAFFSEPSTIRFGTVGPVCPGCEARIAEDGEVLVKGPIVARGYHNLPEKTAAAFIDGWYRTGDIGELDENDCLHITDRKTDLIKTSGGKYVAPQKVEAALMANCPYLSQAVALGEGHKYIVALVTLDPEKLALWGRRHGYPRAGYAELARMPQVHDSIQRYVDRANTHLERWETVKRFAILDTELDDEEGMVTTSLKVRRNVVDNRYRGLWESLYDADGDPRG